PAFRAEGGRRRRAADGVAAGGCHGDAVDAVGGVHWTLPTDAHAFGRHRQCHRTGHQPGQQPGHQHYQWHAAGAVGQQPRAAAAAREQHRQCGG
ncbi:hypothetical protein B8W90_12175, partial [Staphylococcus hominis]